ncbi:MAG: thiamine pyrophosphokinase [Paracoccaceae bacterium]|nr:MAG: thiamine pyrophosphokinase [Alphaproteobacteria bacterium]GIX15660.1 MAG: thiamine pyrophosphokinase [Paracoccaceae bacterium]
MKNERILTNVAVTLVGAGPVDGAALEAALGFAPRLIAADGGALRLAGLNRRPEAIIGDLDSLGPREPWLEAGIPVHHIAEQESTDFAKCLRMVEAPLYLALGFVGDRLDHFLAALSVLAAMPARRVILIGEGDLCLLAPREIALDLPRGTRVSIWPIAPTRVERAEGLVWPAGGLVLEPMGRIGTSNAARGGRVSLAFASRTAFLILPLAALGTVIAALSTRAD